MESRKVGIICNSNSLNVNGFNKNLLETKEIKEILSLLKGNNVKYISQNIKRLLNITDYSLFYNYKNRVEVVLYLRLSEEDKNMLTFDVSKSIKNQLIFLLNEAKRKNFDVVGIYCDEDITGADDSRPEFQKMIKGAENRAFEIVLCKTQSRFSRNADTTLNLLLRKFKMWGIRFIAVCDNIDTKDSASNKTASITALANQWLLEDQSENVKKILESKKRSGLYSIAFAPYGYMKDKKDKYTLKIDNEVEWVIKFCFEKRAMGWSFNKIAKTLHEKGVENPTTHKRRLQSNFKTPNIDNSFEKTQWSAITISNLIKNPIYYGSIALFRRQKLDYREKRRVYNANDKWEIIEDVVPAIISKNLFLKAQKSVTFFPIAKTENLKENFLLKKVVCGSCGKYMCHCHSGSSNKGYNYFRCKRQGVYKNEKCENVGVIKEKILIEEIEKEIKCKIKKYLNEEELNKKLLNNKHLTKKESDLEKLKEKIKVKEKEIENNNLYLIRIYEDKVNKIITNDEFDFLKHNYENNKINLTKERDNLIKELEKHKYTKINLKNLEDIIKKYKKIEKIDKSIIDIFIDNIIIKKKDKNGNREIIINWKI